MPVPSMAFAVCPQSVRRVALPFRTPCPSMGRYRLGKGTVPCPKEQDGKPLGSAVPGIIPLLREAFEQAEDGALYVVIGTRKTSDNLRTQLKRIVVRAGLKPWPKTWHNLRASRQTELAARFPIHVVCSWLGNSPRVAQDHYLQVTDTDFAAGSTPVKPVQQAAQNPAQYASEMTGNDRKALPLETKNPPVLAGDFVPCHILAGETMTLTGFEPVSRP